MSPRPAVWNTGTPEGGSILGGFQTRDLAGCGVIGMGLQGSRLPLLLACCLTVQSPSCRPPLLGPLLYSGPRWAVASQTPESQTLPASSPFCHSEERRNERNCKRTLGVQEDALCARARSLCKRRLLYKRTLAACYFTLSFRASNPGRGPLSTPFYR